MSLGLPLSSRDLFAGSSAPQAPDPAQRWIPAINAGMMMCYELAPHHATLDSRFAHASSFGSKLSAGSLSTLNTMRSMPASR